MPPKVSPSESSKPQLLNVLDPKMSYKGTFAGRLNPSAPKEADNYVEWKIKPDARQGLKDGVMGEGYTQGWESDRVKAGMNCVFRDKGNVTPCDENWNALFE